MNLNSVIDKNKLQNAVDNALLITNRNFIKFQDIIPEFYTVNGRYQYMYSYIDRLSVLDSFWGFWPGIIWLAYELTGNDCFRCYEQKLIQHLYTTLCERSMKTSNHGFHIIPCCVPGIRISQNKIAEKSIILAADSLTDTFFSLGKFICSSTEEFAGNTHCVLISNLINNRILDFAYELSGNENYLKVAETDRKTIISSNIDQNGCTYFRRYFDKNSGELLNNRGDLTYTVDIGLTMRSYAWALYGLSINYSATKDPFYAQKFNLVFDYIKKHEQSHGFISARLSESEHSKKADSTSAAIIFAALVDFLNNDEINNDTYADTLSKIANTLVDEYSINPSSTNEGLISHAYIEKVNLAGESYILGDYFYLEALTSLLKKHKSFWH